MDPITLATLAALVAPPLGQAFGTVAKKVLEKIVELSLVPTIDIVKSGLLKEYDSAKAQNELRATVIAALDEMREKTFDPFERLMITNEVTGEKTEAYQLMAAAAVEMVDDDPNKIPQKLITALQLDESRRPLLARFLVYLRRHLANTETYSGLIQYANELEQYGHLAGLSMEVAEIAKDTDRIRSLFEMMVSEQRLTDDDKHALEEYMSCCRKDWERIMLPLVRKNVGPLLPSLKRVFEPLLVRDEKAEDEIRKKTGSGSIRMRLDEVQEHVIPVDFISAFKKYKRFALIGLPGTGKTTLLHRVVLAFAQGRAREDLGWSGSPMMPIFVRLRNFGIYLAENRKNFSAPGAGALVAYLDQHVRSDENIDIPHDFFEQRLCAGNCIVFLDGLDEVLENRVEVAQFVEAFITKYSQYENWIGISSRPKGYEGDARLQLAGADLAVLEVLPLQPSGICSLIEKLLPLLEPDPHKRREDFTQLTERILANSNLTEIAGVPLFCSALVQVYKYHGADLPQRRVDILVEIVDLLLGFWYAQQSDIRDPEKLARTDGTTLAYGDTQESVEQKHDRLAHLAYYMQADLGQAEISSERAQEHLEIYLSEHEGISSSESRRWAKSFLRSAHEQSGLFVESHPGYYTFLHKNFMEYFAASSILQDQYEPLAVIMQHVEEEWWEQVILLAASHPKTTTSFRKKLMPTILEKSKTVEKGSSKWLRYLTMGGWMARDMTTRLPAPQREEIEKALHEAAIDSSIAPTSRAQLAEVLDSWWLPVDLYTFVQADGFWISKYPVTNAQYERFLQQENFTDQEMWCDFPKFDEKSQTMKATWKDQGWQWLQQASKDKDYLFEAGILYPMFWRNRRYGFLNPGKPVVGVSWYEANAYCKWLARNWNELEEGRQGYPVPGEIRLPTEEEWALAAGGDKNKNRYAWDNEVATTTLDEILKRANNLENKIDCTTLVWMYPLGISPFGVMDMTGNIFQWQQNYFDKDHDPLGLRGGSWADYPANAHVANRSYCKPGFRLNSVGFRVVCLPR